jgi:hypothetical protein
MCPSNRLQPIPKGAADDRCAIVGIAMVALPPYHRVLINRGPITKMLLPHNPQGTCLC